MLQDVEVSIDPEYVLDQLDVEDVVNYYGDDIFDLLSIDKFIEKFGVDEVLENMDFETIENFVKEVNGE